MILPPLTGIIEESEKYFVASCPELDVVSQGETAEAAEYKVHEAIEFLLECADDMEISPDRDRPVCVGFRNRE